MKWFLGSAFLATAAFSLYQNSVIKDNNKTLVAFENAAYQMVKAYESASARSNKWEQRFYSCAKLQVVSVP
jgi:hypothetical protein